MKRLLLLLLCMLAYTPAAFASTWQEDVEAVTSHPEKVYEVYCGMPYEDFEQTWEKTGWPSNLAIREKLKGAKSST